MKTYLRHILVLAIGIASTICFMQGGAGAAVTMSPGISVQNTYSDNINLASENERHDFITSLGPSINLGMTGRSTAFNLSYQPVYASYLRFPRYNTMRHRAVMDGSRQISRTTRFEFNDNYQYTEEPLYISEDAPLEVDTDILRGRNPYHMNTSRIGVINQFGPENVIDLQYEYYFLKNENDTIEDREYYQPDVTITFWPSPNRIGTESEISFTRRNFDDSGDYDDVYGRLRLIRRLGPHFDFYAQYTHELTDYVDVGNDYQVASPLLGFIWNEYMNATFEVSFGYFNQEKEKNGDESGPVGTIETRYTFQKGTAVSIAGSTGYDQDTSGAEVLGFNKYYTFIGTLKHPLSRRLISNFTAGYRQSLYTELDPERQDSIWESTAGLTYQPLPWMTLEVKYSFRKVNSDINADDYTENRAAIAVFLNPRKPVMLIR